MIDFRYHVVSLISVFLAIALGIVIGTTQLNSALVDGLRNQVTDLSADKRDLEERSQTLEGQLDQDDAFGETIAPVLVAGQLPAARVLVVVAAESVDPDITDQTIELIETAGAEVTGVLALRPDYSDPQRSNDLQNYATGEGLPPGITLPETDDAGELVGALLAEVLMSSGEGTDPVEQTATTTVLAGLSSLDVLSVESAAVGSADYAVILTADGVESDDADAHNAALAALAAALDAAGQGAVVAGDALSAGGNGLVGFIRNNPALATSVSTVDNINVAAGRVSAVLSLTAEGQGTSGKYGTGQDTQPVPPLDQ
ncbi:copper transporter [soil metagenome]